MRDETAYAISGCLFNFGMILTASLIATAVARQIDGIVFCVAAWLAVFYVACMAIFGLMVAVLWLLSFFRRVR